MVVKLTFYAELSFKVATFLKGFFAHSSDIVGIPILKMSLVMQSNTICMQDM